MALEIFTLPAGAVCKRGGVPFVLHHATRVECNPDNWPLIRDGFVPSIDGQALESGTGPIHPHQHEADHA